MIMVEAIRSKYHTDGSCNWTCMDVALLCSTHKCHNEPDPCRQLRYWNNGIDLAMKRCNRTPSCPKSLVCTGIYTRLCTRLCGRTGLILWLTTYYQVLCNSYVVKDAYECFVLKKPGIAHRNMQHKKQLCNQPFSADTSSSSGGGSVIKQAIHVGRWRGALI